jgi:hypothetical protein
MYVASSGRFTSNLSQTALEAIAHGGFLESHFLEAITCVDIAELPMGYVRFLPLDSKEETPQQSGQPVKDGQHRLRPDKK